MNHLIGGKVHIFGNNIDTDQIYPGCYLELTDPEQISSHCLEGADPAFARQFQPGDIVAAGTNFGCGSSREHAAIALKTLGVGAVIAPSFARIFYRNAINMGLPLLICPQITDIAGSGDPLEIDLQTHTITNLRTGSRTAVEPISDYARTILAAGGIKSLLNGEE